jgi:heterodisulfide reductase subunit B
MTKTDYKMLHLHIQQLAALCMGADPYDVVGLQTHSLKADWLLERLKQQPAPLVAVS